MTDEVMSKRPRPGLSMLAVFRNRNYRLLWTGRVVSMLGVQFTMIALPWLVLQLTGSGLAMGAVMASGGIPRAAFMLVGGALTDRFSSRTIMVTVSLLFSALLAFQSGLVLTGVIALWMLYGINIVFGTLGAFYFPAVASMVPQIVEDRHLTAANALLQGTVQLCAFIGPAVAGMLIAFLSGRNLLASGAEPGLEGVGLAFAITSSTFFFVSVLVWMMRVPKVERAAGDEEAGMLRSIRQGFAFVWNDKSLRASFFLVAAMNFFTLGPVTIGVPVLANTRFPEGVAAFGIIVSGFGGGALLGAILAGVLPAAPERRLGPTLTRVASLLGIAVLLLGFAPSTAVAASITTVMGMGVGYVSVLMVTWFQRRTPKDMLGRAMSLLMFASAGLLPFSMAISGAVVEFSTTGVFVGAGVCVFLVSRIAARSPAIRDLGQN